LAEEHVRGEEQGHRYVFMTACHRLIVIVVQESVHSPTLENIRTHLTVTTTA